VNVWSRTCCRAGRGASVSSGRPEQCKKRGAAANVYLAPPPSSSRRRLHRRPNVTRPAALPFLALYPSFESLPVSAPSIRCAPVPSSFPHERPPNHASSVVAWHLGDPTPSLQDAYVRVPLHCSRCRLGRGTPHDAPPRRVSGAALCLAPLCSGLRAVLVLCRWRVSHPSCGHAHPSAQCHDYATSCSCAWTRSAAASWCGMSTSRRVTLLAGLHTVRVVSAGTCVRVSWTMHTPAPRPGFTALLNARSRIRCRALHAAPMSSRTGP
jgi:hypothetical protein